MVVCYANAQIKITKKEYLKPSKHPKRLNLRFKPLELLKLTFIKPAV